jgi:hypothetical protein
VQSLFVVQYLAVSTRSRKEPSASSQDGTGSSDADDPTGSEMPVADGLPAPISSHLELSLSILIMNQSKATARSQAIADVIVSRFTGNHIRFQLRK